MPTTGELYPASATTSQVAAGDMAWQSTPNVLTDDGTGANVTATGFTAAIYTQILKVTNFTMPAGISAGSKIDGVIMKMEGWGTGSCIMTSCNLLGTDREVSGTNKSGTSGMLSAVTVIYSYGNASDKWGMVLTPTAVGNANFGVGVRVRSRGAASTAKDIWIDYITLEIIYDTNLTNVTFVEC
jgi:hypothetical protein